MKRPDVEPLALSPEQVAQALSLGRSTIYEAIRNGALPYIEIFGKKRIRVDDLKAWLAKQPAVTGIVDLSEGAA